MIRELVGKWDEGRSGMGLDGIACVLAAFGNAGRDVEFALVLA